MRSFNAILTILLHSIFSIFGHGSQIGGINSVRFSLGTNKYEDGRDGVLEIQYNGTWGTVCNYGFDELAASTTCFMMGFSPRGVPILNSARRSPLKVLLSNFNCTGRIILPSSNPSTATVHLGICSFTQDTPSGCADDERQTSVLCLDPVPIRTLTTPVPDYATMAPVDCSLPSSSSIRLTGGTDSSGLVEIQHPETKKWGTICADGFDAQAARTLCRMLCTSADQLKFAYPVLYSYGEVAETIPIHLARIGCPVNSTNLNECDLGGGWGAVSGCTHAMDVGLHCGPSGNNKIEDNYTPDLLCDQRIAIVKYEKTLNPDLNKNLIKLYGQVPVECQFHVNETETHFVATIPLVGCGGSLSMSNETTIAVKMELMREYMAPDDEVISNLPIRFTLTCLIPRENRIISDALVSPQFVSKIVGNTTKKDVALKLFHDPGFTHILPQGQPIRPGTKVYVRVSLKNPQVGSKLILKNCWATSQPDRQSTPRKDLLVNRCSVFDGLLVHPISKTDVAFSFRAFYLSKGGVVVPLLTSLYLHCDTLLCRRNEQSRFCQQFCTRLNKSQIITQSPKTSSTTTTAPIAAVEITKSTKNVEKISTESTPTKQSSTDTVSITEVQMNEQKVQQS